MNLTPRVSDGDVTLGIGGEIDLSYSDELREVARSLLGIMGPLLDGTLTLDLRAVTFIDSTGLSAVLAVRTEAEQAGKR